jgi:hypothetical protein
MSFVEGSNIGVASTTPLRDNRGRVRLTSLSLAAPLGCDAPFSRSRQVSVAHTSNLAVTLRITSSVNSVVLD